MLADARAAWAKREETLTPRPITRELERRVVLSVLDRKWREHLYEMDYLKEGIGLRAMAQRDPLVEYQREGFDMFAAMLDSLKEESVGFLYNLQVQAAEPARPAAAPAPRRPRPAPAAAQPVAAGRAGDRSADAAHAGGRAGADLGPARQPRSRTGAGQRVAPGVPRNPPGRPQLQRSGRGRQRGALPGRDPAARQGRGGDGSVGDGTAVGGRPSRNRPCPCGSGRKYKQCHGSPTAARP